MFRLLLVLCTVFVLLACQPVSRRAGGVVESQPASMPTQALADGQRYCVEREQSQLRIIVFPDGPLAGFGHSHVVGGAVIEGVVVLTPDPADSQFRLEVAVDELRLDKPQWRRDEGFAPELDEQSIAATRQNMLSSALLNADRYPLIRVRGHRLSGPDWQPLLLVLIELAGTTRQVQIPVMLELTSERLLANGHFSLLQSDFGITPFSAAGGNLRVADRLDLRFRLSARPCSV